MTFAYQSYATFVYGFLGDNRSLRSVMIGITVSLCLWGLSICKRRTILFSLKVLLGYCVLFGAAYIFYPQNRIYIADIVMDSFVWLFFIIFTYELSEKEFITWMSRTAFFILFCNSFEIVHKYVTSQPDGYMVYGMRVMTCAVMFIYLYFLMKKTKHLVGFILTAFLILALGNRSAFLICIILFLVGYIRNGENITKTFRRIVLVSFVAVFVSSLINSIISMLVEIIDYLGMTSRTLTKFIDGSVAEDNGRYIIWGNATEKIKEKWLTGYGIGADRSFTLIGNIKGYYVHNIFLELFINFGIIISSVIVVVIIYNSLRVFLDKKSENIYAELYIYVFIATMIKLFFSSSLWIDIMAYWCVAVYMKYKSQKNMTMERLIYGK